MIQALKNIEAALTKLGASLSITGGTDYRRIVLDVARPSWSPAWNLLMDAVARPNTDEYYLANRLRG